MHKHFNLLYVGLARNIYAVCIRYFWQGNHQIYGHIRCIYTDLANPNYTLYAETELGNASSAEKFYISEVAQFPVQASLITPAFSNAQMQTMQLKRHVRFDQPLSAICST